MVPHLSYCSCIGRNARRTPCMPTPYPALRAKRLKACQGLVKLAPFIWHHWPPTAPAPVEQVAAGAIHSPDGPGQDVRSTFGNIFFRMCPYAREGAFESCGFPSSGQRFPTAPKRYSQKWNEQNDSRSQNRPRDDEQGLSEAIAHSFLEEHPRPEGRPQLCKLIPRYEMPQESKIRLEIWLLSVPSYLSLRYTTSPMPTCARIFAHSWHGNNVT